MEYFCKVALIFGKKPDPQGCGDREGEEEFAKDANSREMQESALWRFKCRVYVLERTAKGDRAEDPPARAGAKW